MIKHQRAKDECSLGNPQKSNETCKDLFLQLRNLILMERCYLDSGLISGQICLRLQTTPASLLKSLKSNGFRSFSHFINLHRVEEAKNMMAQEAFEVYTLEAIAEKAGFGTRQAFYNAFERLVGMKPSLYRRIMKKQFSEWGSIITDP